MKSVPVFSFEPPLTMFEETQMKDLIIDQLDSLEEKQEVMLFKQKQLRNQYNPLLKRLIDLQKRKPASVEKVQGDRDGSLVTTKHYFVRTPDKPSVSSEDKNTKVEVPSFREAKVSKIRLRRISDSSSWEILPPESESKKGLQGYEDTSDDAYKKLHDKLEKGEKRMKRRDLKQQRDQELKWRRAENLKKKGKKTRKESPSSSLLPNPEFATHIQIEDYLPVTAFGLSIPVLLKEDFSLPWQKPTSNSSQSDI